MYNVGKSIKNLAIVLLVFGLFCSIIFSILFMFDYSFGLGVVIFMGCSITSYIIYLLLYGYGELIENSTIIANKYKYKKNLFYKNISINDTIHNRVNNIRIKTNLNKKLYTTFNRINTSHFKY